MTLWMVLNAFCSLWQPLHTKLALQKKKAKDGKSKYDTEDKDFPIPVSVTVIRRDPSQDEEDVREETREKFMEVSIVTDTVALGLLFATGRNYVGDVLCLLMTVSRSLWLFSTIKASLIHL